MEPSFTLFRIRGIPIGMNWSWVLIFSLIVWSLADGLFPRTYPGLRLSTYWAMAVVAGVLFVTSLLLHELGHATRAQREGMEIEGITLWFFGGVARFRGMFPSAGAEFRIAIAGPIVSAILVLLFAAAAWGATSAGAPDAVVGVADYLARINALLLGFNMIPALPLDGGRVLRAYLWYRGENFAAATTSAARAARGFAWALIAFGALGFVTGAGLGGLWFVFIGWFLMQAAQSETAFAQVRSALQGVRVRDLMSPDPYAVSPDQSIFDFIEEVAHPRGYSTYPVLENGDLVGLVSLKLAGAVPAERRGESTIRDVMVTRDDVPVVGPNDEVTDAIPSLQRGMGRALVVDDGRVVGILAGSDIARAVEVGALRADPTDSTGRRRRRRPLLWIFGGGAILVFAALIFTPPVVVLGPGDSFDVVGDIKIKGVETDKVDGKYLLTSVAVQRPNGLGLIVAMARSREILPLSSVVPRGVDEDVFFKQQARLFSDTQRIAAAAAARAAGMVVELKGSGAAVVGVAKGTPAAKVLKEGDTIVAVDGDKVQVSDDLGRTLRAAPAGTVFTLGVERGRKRLEVQVRTRGGLAEGGAPGIGVQLETRDLDVDLPFDVTFSSHEIGGPSAGLTYALAVYDLIESSNLAAGRAIASTGTIDLEGRIGAVGGVEEKALSAIGVGAELFLVPADEVTEASDAKLPVRGVATLADAVHTLRASS